MDNSTNVASGFDLEALRDFAVQMRSTKVSLADEQHEAIAEPLAPLEVAVQSPTPEAAEVMGALRSMEAIATKDRQLSCKPHRHDGRVGSGQVEVLPACDLLPVCPLPPNADGGVSTRRWAARS